MARVSLKEAYDNKDVVAQIYAIRDIAEGASDTADSAKTTADDAKTYVDTLGVQVEGAVQTANNASASAQTSAETVAGYDARLTEVEGDLNQAESDIDGLETGLGAVTARVTTAEGNIVTIQGRVTALETADGQNVKINDVNQYAVGLTGNQNVDGIKAFYLNPKIASLYERFGTAGDYIIGKIPTPSQTVVVNAIVASREFNGIQLWNISVFSNGTISVTDQLGGTPPTIKHMVKDNEHYLAVTTNGNSIHYSIKWVMCRVGGTITFMSTVNLPVMNDGSYEDVNA